MERKYKSQGRQLLEDLSPMPIISKIQQAAGRLKTDPKSIKMKKIGTKRPKSMRKTAAKASSTPMDKERTARIDLIKEYDRDIYQDETMFSEYEKNKKKQKPRAKKLSKFKKGGPITYRMSGGQVVDNSYD